MNNILVGLIFGIVICSCSESQQFQSKNSLVVSDFEGIRGQVFDAETGQGLAARIAIKDTVGNVVDSYYDHSPGFFTEEDGKFAKTLPAGKYEMEVYHGIDRLSSKFKFKISVGRGVDARIYLKPWINLRKRGWVNGDGHCHLFTDKKPDTEMANLVRTICLAQGVDFVCAAQGWAGYNDSTWIEGYDRLSDSRFILHYGSEMPKYRTGHTWWIGQKSTMNYYDQSMDTTYLKSANR